ncbi:Aspartate/glutamate/uridylate kinase [Lineolata rhizophorae]|uniref:Aspartokinase n=1 Tax=Lineolata rhizophorae TaxID=578093 RepID=A0A6A6NZK5_9PEZI|nr:Aspartate/glutamate/uridylate kinase [Lineolata rhizophorae]
MAANAITFHPEQSITPHTPEKNLPGGWVVQKFGGTSVGKFPLNITGIVEAGVKNNRIAIVCSARSNNTKIEGTTNRLLRAAREAEKAGTRHYDPIVATVRDDHIASGVANIKTEDILASYNLAVEAECASLTKILESAQHLEEVSTRAEDKIISKGEKLACLFMVAVLQDRGVPAQYVDLADVVKLEGGAHSLTERFYADLTARLAEQIRACGDKVPVMTGYFGNVPGGLLNGVGRGYTDLCAALVAVGIGAEELQIWKEVDGIFTADPRKVPTASLLQSVTPAEAAELTFYGSEVIHPFTMEQVIRARIPIRIKNVMNPRNAGTVIFPDPETEVDPRAPLRDPRLFRTRSASNANGLVASKPKRPTAVTIKRQIVVINVHSNKRTRAHGFLMNIFSTLDRWHLSVDLISSSEVHVSMALHSESAAMAGTSAGPGEEGWRVQDDELLGAVRDLEQHGTVDLVPNMAIISLVGRQLKNMVGISGRFLGVLGECGINIEMISQGASEINISCVIEEREADRALNVVHTNLFTFLE